MQQFKMKVSTTYAKGEKLPDGKIAGKSQRIEVGNVAVTAILLADCVPYVNGASFKQALDEKGKPKTEIQDEKEVPVYETDDDGLPVYETEEANFIMSALTSYIKASVRNKLITGSVALKEGQTIPTTWAEFVAESGGRTGAALAALRDCKAAFAAYVATLGKKEGTANIIITLFGNRDALALQAGTMKERMKGYIEAFAETLPADKLEAWEKPIERVLATCAAETEVFIDE